jgi:DNA polymerase-3 subunit beta
MRLSVERDELYRAMQIASSIIPSRQLTDIFSNMLMVADSGELKITATDLEVSAIISLPADVDESFSFAIPSKKMTQLVRELPNTIIDMECDEDYKLTIKPKGGEIDEVYNISGVPADDFPEIPFPTNVSWVSFSADELEDIFAKTVFASSQGKDTFQYVFNGIYFFSSGNTLDVVATDGKRLSFIRKEKEIPNGLEISAIVPIKAIQEMRKVISDVSECQLAFDEKQAYFKAENVVIIARLIEGKFPDYEAVIPSDTAITVKLDRELVLSSLRKASLFTKEEQFRKTFFSFRRNQLILSSEDELGSAKISIPIEYADEDFDIAFNNSYVSDVLKAVKSESFYIGMNGSKVPALFWFEDEENFKYVLMPVKT